MQQMSMVYPRVYAQIIGVRTFKSGGLWKKCEVKAVQHSLLEAACIILV